MKAPVRIFLGTVAGFFLIAVGLSAGLYLKFEKNRISIDIPETVEPNLSVYDVSPPSRGTVLKTLEITIVPKENRAYALVPKYPGNEIKTGQKVLLHDANGQLLETLGQIVAIYRGGSLPEQFIGVLMDLNTDKAVPSNFVAKGKIVVGGDPAAQRLPLSALVKGRDGQPYVWEIHEGNDGTTTVYYKRANVTLVTKDFFVIDPKIPGDNVFVLKPDDRLRDGQTINVKMTLFSAPPLTDQSRIEALMEARRNAPDNPSIEENSSPLGVCEGPVYDGDGFVKRVRDAANPVSSIFPPR